MSDPWLAVLVEADDDGFQRVSAPRIGFWSDLPRFGALLGPGSPIGVLRQLNRRFRLILPDGAAGTVVDGLPDGRIVAVEYGGLLCRLQPAGAEVTASGSGEAPSRDRTGAELPDGLRAIVSPTDGVFYQRSAPGEPTFVEVGQKLRLDQPVGLVEVMKTFNQIHYGGPGAIDGAEVVEIRAGDAEEVRAGQILVVVRGTSPGGRH